MLSQSLCDDVQGIAPQINEHQVVSAFGKQSCDCPSETAGGSGNYRHPSFAARGHVSPSSTGHR